MRREYLWALLTLVIAVLLAIFLLNIAKDDAPRSEVKGLDLYDGISLDATLLKLDRRALDEAYHAQVILLFSTWLKQQAGDTTYFRNGLKLARRAYHHAAEQIEKRQRMLEEQQRK